MIAGMHAAIVSGLHTSLTVGGVIALAAALLALAARPGSGAPTEPAARAERTRVLL